VHFNYCTYSLNFFSFLVHGFNFCDRNAANISSNYMLIITNKMQRNTIFFIAVKAVKAFELLMMGEEPPETCRALTAIKNIVLHCILLVIISIY
jgi:hypothetical protein